MTHFNPQKVRLADYPHPVGTIMRGSMGSLAVIVDRDGFAFRACCLTHEAQGCASGYYIQAENGRILDRSVPEPEATSTGCDLDAEADEDEACGEGMCRCHCGDGHACGCDCWRCDECMQISENCHCDDE